MCFLLESIIKGFYCECRKYVYIHTEKAIIVQTSLRKTIAIRWYLLLQKSNIKISPEWEFSLRPWSSCDMITSWRMFVWGAGEYRSYKFAWKDQFVYLSFLGKTSTLYLMWENIDKDRVSILAVYPARANIWPVSFFEQRNLDVWLISCPDIPIQYSNHWHWISFMTIIGPFWAMSQIPSGLSN